MLCRLGVRRGAAPLDAPCKSRKSFEHCLYVVDIHLDLNPTSLSPACPSTTAGPIIPSSFRGLYGSWKPAHREELGLRPSPHSRSLTARNDEHHPGAANRTPQTTASIATVAHSASVDSTSTAIHFSQSPRRHGYRSALAPARRTHGLGIR